LRPFGASIVILNERNEILLLKRSSRSRWMPAKWGLPGGTLEINETTQAAALRETLEETQLRVAPESMILLSLDEKVAIYFSMMYNGVVKIDREHSDWAWVMRKNLTAYDTVPDIAELFDGALNYGKK
jgi:ADP-ribose pyrophosphatase YjhB (NUDIX family)